MADPRQNLQALSEEYEKLQQGDPPARATSGNSNADPDISQNIQQLQALESQRQENTSVKKEVDSLVGKPTIYKLIGPVLLKQDKSEVETTVNGRLRFLEGQM
jgi:prefoldin beta subunit